MRMLKERLQIMVDRDQRRGLDAEAKRLGISVGALVREAIDARLGGQGRTRRRDAVAEMERVAGGKSLSPQELDQILDEERSLPPGRGV